MRHRTARGGLSETAAMRLAGAGLILLLVVLITLALALFNRTFTRTVPITVESERAGLVMDRDADVRARGVSIGHVASIDEVDGKSVLTLEVRPSELESIPADSPVRIGSNTVFGAKSVDFEVGVDDGTAPATVGSAGAPTGGTLQAGDRVEAADVTTEMNTLFENLTNLLQSTDPERLNATLGAVATAFDGRGNQFGETIETLNRYLSGTINPNLDALQRDLAKAGQVSNLYADVTPDLMGLLDAGTDVGNNLLRQQAEFEHALVSMIGAGQTGDALLTENGDALVKMLRDMRATTSLLNEYHPMMSCLIVGLNQGIARAGRAVGAERQPGLTFLAGFAQGAKPYEYPKDLPKVNASTGPDCYGLPFTDPDVHAPFVVTDTGSNVMEGQPNINDDYEGPLFRPLEPTGPGEPAPPTLLQVMLGMTEGE